MHNNLLSLKMKLERDKMEKYRIASKTMRDKLETKKK